MVTIPWLLSWSLLVALATLLSIVTLVRSSEIHTGRFPQSHSFCDIHLVPRGYGCEVHKLYSDDGYMLLLHRVVLRGNHETTHWKSPAQIPAPKTPFPTRSEYPPSLPPSSHNHDARGELRPIGLMPPNSPHVGAPWPTAETHVYVTSSPTRAPRSSGSFRTTNPTRASGRSAGGALGSSLSRTGSREAPAARTPGSFNSFCDYPPSSRTGSFRRLPSGAPGNCIPFGGSAQSPRRTWAPGNGIGDGKRLHGMNHPDDKKSKINPHLNPVLLMHHEMQNGGSWFQHAKPGYDPLLPLILADQGFDVWVGHERATFWSHDHLRLSVYEDAYWDFTWDEHVRYDVPKMLRHITDLTGAKVHYVGVSVSAAVGTAAATTPSVANLLQSLTLIAPAIYRGNNSSGIQAMAQFFARAGLNYSLPKHRHGAFNFAMEFHLKEIPLVGAGSAWRFAISGPDCCLGPGLIPLQNGWDGVTSLKNIWHIHQAISTNTFQRFDYGSPGENALVYNRSQTPPAYEPKNIPADLPILVIYGGQDSLIPPEGVLDFMASMPTKPYAFYLPLYAHFDLILSLRRADDVYRPIEAFLLDEFRIDRPYH